MTGASACFSGERARRIIDSCGAWGVVCACLGAPVLRFVAEVARERRADAPEPVGARACHPADRRRMFAVRDEIVSKQSRGRLPCARSAEWAAISVELRMAYMMVAGVDGDLSALAVKAWPEFTPPEREAIRSTVRAFAKAARASVALVSRWGDD